jgi:hypothetical protein
VDPSDLSFRDAVKDTQGSFYNVLAFLPHGRLKVS